MTAYSNSWTVPDYIRMGIKGMPAGSLVGIDVTNRCNLRCTHCYFFKQPHQDELSTGEWLNKFEKLKQEGFPFLICGWIGGEPLLRAFVVVVLGGLGNMGGTIGAAYIIGLLEATVMTFLGIYWTAAILFLVMIIILIVRPTADLPRPSVLD